MSSIVSSENEKTLQLDEMNASEMQATQPIPKKSQQIKTDKPRPHVCTICTRGFARLEHLKRHERSHTNEKPFQCASCGRCFARRDLVLRHQQKLHTSLVNGLRRNSSKDSDSNEHIIVLHNNTSANAPLPSQEHDTVYAISPVSSQIYSPPKGGDPSWSHKNSKFRTSLLNQSNDYQDTRTSSPRNGILSPLPTNSCQNTPPNTIGTSINGTGSSINTDNQESSPQSAPNISNSPTKISLMKKSTSNQLKNNPDVSQGKNSGILQYRHASFSASSGISYTNVRDALNIQKNNKMNDVPSHVEFATPRLDSFENRIKNSNSGFDLQALGVDWTKMDNIDLGNPYVLPNDVPIQDMSLTGTDLSIGKERQSKSMSHYFDNNIVASHQFQHPNHPHHISGTTPLEFGMTSYNESLLNNIMFDNNGNMKNNAGNQNSDSGQDATNIHKSKENNDLMNGIGERNETSLKRSLSPNNMSKRHRPSEPVIDGDWLREMINPPYNTNFPSASHEIGFNSLQKSDSFTNNNEIPSLFKSRQIDLVKQMDNFGNFEGDEGLEAFSMNAHQPSFTFITKEFREKIISMSKLVDSQFPPLDDLNNYIKQYELQFNKYFPFIHLPSLKNPMVDNFENIPLLLAMAAIGALYVYHDSNTLLLFNISKLHIQNFFEREISLDNLQFKKVPLMTHQCLMLHIFIYIFLDEPNMVEVSSKQMKSMVGLFKSTHFNQPLEKFLIPPPKITEDSDMGNIQKNFDYFIMAQSRIRTIHFFQLLQVFRSTLVGSPIIFASQMLDSGNYCIDEQLWRCSDSRQWHSRLVQTNNVGSSIIDLSNGISFSNLTSRLYYNSGEMKLSSFNLLSLLIYIHEEIENEVLKYDLNNFDCFKWRLNSRSKLDSLLTSWESLFIRSGGFTTITNQNSHLLNSSNEYKVIIPLYLFAKIRLSVNLVPVMQSLLNKDWRRLNTELQALFNDSEGLKESVDYSLDIINLWVHNISVVNDAKQTSLRTPVFFVTCIFVSICVISTYLNYLEKAEDLRVIDKINWLKCEKILLKVESVLSPINESNSYYESLIRQCNASNSAKNIDVKKLSDMNADKGQFSASIREIHLSAKTLYLGVRILADAPVWPIAMGYAEALKSRASDINFDI